MLEIEHLKESKLQQRLQKTLDEDDLNGRGRDNGVREDSELDVKAEPAKYNNALIVSIAVGIFIAILSLIF